MTVLVDAIVYVDLADACTEVVILLKVVGTDDTVLDETTRTDDGCDDEDAEDSDENSPVLEDSVDKVV